MKIQIQISIVACLLTVMSFTCVAQTTFEGVIIFNSTNTIIKEKATVTLYMKDGSSRFEFDSNAGGQHVEYTILTDGKGMYMMSESGGAEITNPKPHEGIPNAQLMGKEVGVTMNGHLCDRLLFDTGNGKISYWLTTGLPLSYRQLPSMMRDNMPKFEGYDDSFPVKMEMTDAEGNIVRTQGLVSINESVVNDSKFERK